MAIRVPNINPIRFRKINEEPDYNNFWPNDYNMVQQVGYYSGINATKFFKDFVQNIAITLQIEVTSEIGQQIRVWKLNDIKVWEQADIISPIDITPTGWVSGTVYKYEWTGTTGGVYYFDVIGQDIISDSFIVQDNDKFKKRLVKIEYWNSYNDFNSVFDENGTNLYKSITFFEGQLTDGDLSNEISGYNGDRGKFVKTRSTPVNTALLKIFKTNKTYRRLINTIFACDNIYVNNIRYTNEETPSRSDIRNSDLSNFEVNLKEVDINYLLK